MRRGLWKRLGAVLALGLTALPAGCGGGGGATSGTGDTGEIVVGLTDAEGDFVRYEVGVVSLELTRADGTVVEAIPMETRVDFAELAELTEFVTAATVPAGSYTGARLTLDYTDAEIWVEGEDGEPVEAVAVDPEGGSIETLTLDVRLEGRDHLRIVPGVPALLTLDFDLAATHEVDMSQDPVRVTVEPVLLADVNPEVPKLQRVRGRLLGVDEEDRSFTLALRPFRIAPRDLGRITVTTGDDTEFEVDGEAAQGAEGLALLAGMPKGTVVMAKGRMNPRSRTFAATEVYAGSSVPGADLDVLTGVVVARDDTSLTVRGRVIVRNPPVVLVGQTVTVTWDDDTTVSKALDPEASHTMDEVSVGQHLRVLGSFDWPVPARPTIEASHVRMLVTRISGTVNGAEPGELRLTLQRIQGRPVDRFDFSGTGAAPEDDADPADYQVDTGPLTLGALEPGAPVWVLGFPTPFGSAPPDFEALSVSDVSFAPARLRVRWLRDSSSEIRPELDRITLDLSEAGRLHHVFWREVAIELQPEPPPVVLPRSPERGVFAIHRPGTPTALFIKFANFTRALKLALDEGLHVRMMSAEGSFEIPSQTFTASRVVVKLR